MSIIRQLKRLQFIDYLVHKKATGDLNTFAKKNRLSRRGLAKVLEEMKEMGFPIKFSRKLNSYFYEKDGEMVKCLFMTQGEVLTREETREINTLDENELCFSQVQVFEVCRNI